MTGWRIVCDVGGTNVRTARCDNDGQLTSIVAAPIDKTRGLTEVLHTFADEFDDVERLSGIAIAAAGPIDGRVVRLTNRDLVIDSDVISSSFSGRPVAVINDLEAVAWSLPYLAATDTRPILQVTAPLTGPRLVLNVGTGFGGALLLNVPGGWHSVACEPGHMRLSIGPDGTPTSGRADDGPSIEDVLSGAALKDSHRLAKYWHSEMTTECISRTSDMIAMIASRSGSPSFVQDYSKMLGQVSGDLVLACGAWGGVYFCGSVATAWCRLADLTAFNDAFLAKGPMANRMARVAVQEIVAPYPALLGLRAVPLL